LQIFPAFARPSSAIMAFMRSTILMSPWEMLMPTRFEHNLFRDSLHPQCQKFMGYVNCHILPLIWFGHFVPFREFSWWNLLILRIYWLIINNVVLCNLGVPWIRLRVVANLHGGFDSRLRSQTVRQ
jgi:hypothetical protein